MDAKDVAVEVEPMKKAPEKGVSLRALYRYATPVDCLYLVAGLVAVIFSGANQPMQVRVLRFE